MPRRRSNNTPLTRLASLLVACALVAPSVGLPWANAEAAAAGGAPPASGRAAKSVPRALRRGAYRDGQLLVRFRQEVSEDERGALAAAAGARRRALRGGSGVELWTLASAQNVSPIIDDLSAHGSVEFAEPNYTITADQLTPDDERFSEQWALRNTGQSGGQPGSDIGVARAWARTTGSPRTVIAVIDSGIDFTHPDLRANRWVNPAERPNGQDDDGDGLADDVGGWDYVENAGEVKDPSGHGTSVAGLIAAHGNNRQGVAGVMWRASLMSLRVLDSTGTGDVAAAVEAIDYASAHNASVINCSWGTDHYSRALSEAVARAGGRGAVVVASAGNDGRNVDASPRYPASYDLPNVVSVASTNNLDQLTPWSNWGAKGATLAAPGAELLTTKPGGDYLTVGGTSASAALVAGLAGLVKTVRPKLSPERVREAMMRGSRRVAALEGRVSSGGVVSGAGAADALDALRPGEGEGEDGRAEDGSKKEGKAGDDRKGDSAVSGPAAATPNNTDVRSVEGVRGRPALRLPDLDAARSHLPLPPQAPPPVPSTLRNCPPHDPLCNGALAFPTPTPIVSRAGRAERVLIAAAHDRAVRPDVSAPLSLLDYIREVRASSDTATPYLELSGLFARAHGLLPSLLAAAQTGNNAAFESQSVPTTMLAGETYSVSVTMRNTGTSTWRPENSYRLGAQNPPNESVWRLGRVQLPTSVLPNETVTIPFTVTAPTAAGTYNFQWQMVQDGVEWFGQPTTNVPVTVSAPNFEGWFESADCSEIKGWAWDPRQPNTPIEVDVFEEVAGGGDIFLARVVADIYRDNIGNKGDNRHGFTLVPPAALRDGNPENPHTVKVRIANTSLLPAGSPPLSGSPKTVRGCAALPGATSAPANLVVTEASDALIKLSWTHAGATHYRVERSLTKSGPFVSAGSTTETTFPDAGRTRGTAYLYRVCSSDSTGSVCVSPYSNVALATAYSFFEPTLYSYAENPAQATTMKDEHIIELRETVNAVRRAAGLGGATWEVIGSPPLIRASHVTELRSNLTAALSALNILPPAYTDPTLYAGANGTPIRKAHIEELRLRSTRASGTVSNQSAQAGTQAPAARLEPRNRTGAGGVDLLSGNFNWGLPLLSLRGRAGLDLGLSLSYNSLVWTKSGSTLHFNPDEGYPAPGFRLGFPVVQPQYYSAETGKNTYLLVTPSGARVEFRQIGTTYEYESADSSYLKLYDNGGGYLHLWTPDGTRMSFFRQGYSHYVWEIRDRNGNKINVSHDSQGRLTSVTDTLSRTVTFNYDANQNLLSITQAWNGQPHTWATFGYGVATIGNVFSDSVTLAGAQEGQALNVLTQVGLADGSSFRFEYNDYAQVTKISRYSADNHQLSYTSYVLSASTDDCPRVTARKGSALDWNNEQEAVTTYARDANGAWGEVTSPDATRYKELYDTGQVQGWKKGLVTETEAYAGGIKQKWTTLQWTQDDTSLAYRKNPRPTQTLVEDKEENRRLTMLAYHGQSSFSLVRDVRECRSTATGGCAEVLRTTRTEYELGAAYVNARVLGLVKERYVYGGDPDAGGALLSKVTYAYDETTDGRLVATPATPTQHDAAYGTGYSTGRGNLTGVKRWSVTTPYTAQNPEFVETKIGYNTTGSAVFTLDPENHKTEVSYSDSFSDDANRNTFAYPTATTDPDQAVVTPESQRKRALTKYHYDMGVVTRVEGVSPNDGQTAPAQTFQYDAAGRLERVTNLVTNAYTRHVYSPGQNWVQTFATLQVNASNQPVESSYSIQVMDGAGRVYASASDHPGTTGRYRGQHTVYDQMGRAVRSSTPTQMTAAWEPVDEDTADSIPAGWYYAEQDYDWMGRPTYSRHPDGAMNQELIYGGCGCAGGEVVTVRDAVDRKQKVYSDVLGRQWKTEVLNPNGTVYSTQTSRFNALDQVTRMRQYDVLIPDPSSEPEGEDTDPQAAPNYQTVTMTYDGHGRLASRKAPVQTSAASYTYYADDQTQTVTDARGATTTFTYNRRNLVTNIAYGGPAPVPAPINYTYDAAGNRTQMTDGAGSTAYVYDQLSRMTSETRQFSGLTGSFPVTYEYTVSGQLKSVKDHVNFQVTYAYDAAGQLLSVAGSGPDSAPTYASNFKYRAWGAVKEFDYGNGARHRLEFNVKSQHMKSVLSNLSPGGYSMTWDYDYHADGRLRHAFDRSDNKFDRLYTYDHAGRLKEARTGNEAGGGSTAVGPYKQIYTYDVWENVTARTSKLWTESEVTENFSYSNNKRGTPWQYDAEGRVLVDGDQGHHVYDAGGRRTSYKNWSHFVGGGQTGHEQQPGYEAATSYDGDGTPVKQVTTRRTEQLIGEGPATEITETVATVYYLRSSVLGGKAVAEINGDGGGKIASPVYVSGMEVARQAVAGGVSSVSWTHTSPQTGSALTLGGGGYVNARSELDPLGADVTEPPQQPNAFEEPSYLDPKWDFFWPIEYTGFWTGEMEEGMRDYALRATARWQANLAQRLWQAGYGDHARAIQHDNPYIGVEVTRRVKLGAGTDLFGFGITVPVTETLWGAEAAAFLYEQATPRIKQTLRGSRLKVFEQAYNLAQNALNASSDCRDALSNDVSRALELNPATFFGAIRDLFFYGGPSPLIRTPEGGISSIIAEFIPAKPNDPNGIRGIALYGDFFDRRSVEHAANAIGFTTDSSLNKLTPRIPLITQAQVRAMVILHEVRHLITGETHRGETRDERRQWNTRILKACFSASRD